jgi:hypothetical protein
MDIVDRLKDEHKEILAILSDLLTSSVEDPQEYAMRYMNVVMRLEAHEAGEERSILAALSSDLDVRPIALQAMEEHRLMRELLRDLADIEVTEEIWLPRLVVVNNVIALHMQIEEGNVLTLVRDSYDDKERERFDREFITERDKILVALRR